MSVNFSGQAFPNTQSLEIPGPITVTKNQTVLTGMCWVRLSKTVIENGDDINFILYSTGTAGGTEIRYKFKMRFASPNPMALDLGGTSPDGGSLLFADSIANALTVGQWYHIAGALDYAASRGFFYVNGDLFDVQPMNGTFTSPTSNTNGVRGRLGSILDGDSEAMAGLMEDVRLYNVHDAAQIKTIATSKGKDGIVANLLHRFQMRDLPTGNVVTVANVAETERITAIAARNPTWSPETITAFTRQTRNNSGRRR
jgi:Concanavalin A-like lectin/glucanases superfamily